MKIKVLFLILISFILNAQTDKVNKIWIDSFVNKNGVVIYPQYSWGIKTSIGKINSFGFIESTPGQRMFTNNLIWYTPPKMGWFSVHTETGGFPAHNLGFFQIGARINMITPQKNKVFSIMFVAILPRFIGIRPNNILWAGATNSIKIKNLSIWGEGYRRFFPDKSGFGEYWLLIKPRNKKFSFGLMGHHTTKISYMSIGIRVPVLN